MISRYLEALCKISHIISREVLDEVPCNKQLAIRLALTLRHEALD